MAIQLSPNGKWIYGDAFPSGTSAILANTIIAIREEPVGGAATPGTWVTTSTGVATLFTGNQAIAIYNLIKDMTIVV